jgi:hypothetical protein
LLPPYVIFSCHEFFHHLNTGCSKIFSPLNLAVTFFLLIKVENSKGKVLLSRVHCSDGVKISKKIFCLNNMVPLMWILSWFFLWNWNIKISSKLVLDFPLERRRRLHALSVVVSKTLQIKWNSNKTNKSNETATKPTNLMNSTKNWRNFYVSIS